MTELADGGTRVKTTVDLVVVGSIGLDTVETTEGKRTEQLGGSLSFACPAAAPFCRVGMVGVVGTDFPAGHKTWYKHLGIDLGGLQQVEGRTFRWCGVYAPDMVNRRTLRTELNVFERFTPELPDHYRDAPYVLLGNIQPELQLHVLEQVRAPRFVVADTMNLWIESARKPLLNVIGAVTMLSLNDEEARMLTEERNLRQAAMRIMEMGPRYVVIKKGEHGAMLFCEDGIFLVPAYPVTRVVDPTGAGDSFAGAFMGSLIRSGETTPAAVRAALLDGSVVASFGVEAFGVESFTTLHMDQISARRRELDRMIAL